MTLHRVTPSGTNDRAHIVLMCFCRKLNIYFEAIKSKVSRNEGHKIATDSSIIKEVLGIKFPFIRYVTKLN